MSKRRKNRTRKVPSKKPARHTPARRRKTTKQPAPNYPLPVNIGFLLVFERGVVVKSEMCGQTRVLSGPSPSNPIAADTSPPSPSASSSPPSSPDQVEVVPVGAAGFVIADSSKRS